VAGKAFLEKTLLDLRLDLQICRLHPPGAIAGLKTVRFIPHSLFLGSAPEQAERIFGLLKRFASFGWWSLGPVAP
jgi:hypothetical protein